MANKKLQLLYVPAGELFPNIYNPNKMSEEIFKKERLSIRTNGFFDPLLVRDRAAGGYEIVDGEHRWLAGKEEGMAEFPVINLGAVPDNVAKQLTIIANDLRGSSDPLKLADLVAGLVGSPDDLDALIASLPYTRGELTTMLEVAKGDFDWNQYIKDEEARRKGGAPKATTHRFRISSVAGSIMPAIAKQLVDIYHADAQRLGSDAPDIVLAEWIIRLKLQEEQADG